MGDMGEAQNVHQVLDRGAAHPAGGGDLRHVPLAAALMQHQLDQVSMRYVPMTWPTRLGLIMGAKTRGSKRVFRLKSGGMYMVDAP